MTNYGPAFIRGLMEWIDYDDTWPRRIRITCSDLIDGSLSIRIMLLGRGKIMRHITGRLYADRDKFRCFECERDVKTLQKGGFGFLRVCGNKDCRVFLCRECQQNHEVMHELAHEPVESPWRRAKKGNTYGGFEEPDDDELVKDESNWGGNF